MAAGPGLEPGVPDARTPFSDAKHPAGHLLRDSCSFTSDPKILHQQGLHIIHRLQMRKLRFQNVSECPRSQRWSHRQDSGWTPGPSRPDRQPLFRPVFRDAGAVAYFGSTEAVSTKPLAEPDRSQQAVKTSPLSALDLFFSSATRESCQLHYSGSLRTAKLRSRV